MRGTGCWQESELCILLFRDPDEDVISLLSAATSPLKPTSLRDGHGAELTDGQNRESSRGLKRSPAAPLKFIFSTDLLQYSQISTMKFTSVHRWFPLLQCKYFVVLKLQHELPEGLTKSGGAGPTPRVDQGWCLSLYISTSSQVMLLVQDHLLKTSGLHWGMLLVPWNWHLSLGKEQWPKG